MKDNNTLISIITVSYNAVNVIEKTIQSVINQTYPNIEYIIIDGGSNDGTIDIIKKYAKYITYWKSEPDKGIYNAMNKGITIAKGQWINFMNAGDIFYNKNIVSEIFSRPINYKIIKVIYGDTIKTTENENIYIKAKKLAQINRTIICCHQSMFVSLHNKNEIIFNEKYKISSDYKVFYDLYDKYRNDAFFYIAKPISVFDGKDGLSSINRKLLFYEQLDIRKDNKNLIWYLDFFRFKFRVWTKYY